jgi:hypothetical protein
MRCERGAVPLYLFPSIFGRVFTKSNKAPCRPAHPSFSFFLCARRKKPIAGAAHNESEVMRAGFVETSTYCYRAPSAVILVRLNQIIRYARRLTPRAVWPMLICDLFTFECARHRPKTCFVWFGRPQIAINLIPKQDLLRYNRISQQIDSLPAACVIIGLLRLHL